MNAPGCTEIEAGVPSLGCLANIVVNIINFALQLIGFVTLAMLAYGSIRFIVSRGDPKAIEGAQKTITYALIGAILVVLSFMLVNIVFVKLLGLPSPLTNFTFFQQ